MSTAVNLAVRGQFIVCLHNVRTFSCKYRDAKNQASLPDACPVCKAFYERCAYCPSDFAATKQNPEQGFTPSAGHLRGTSVCWRHRYGDFPESVDYVETSDGPDPRDRKVEIFFGRAAGIAMKIVTIKCEPGANRFGLFLHPLPDNLHVAVVTEYKEALGFAIPVAFALDDSLIPRSDDQIAGYIPHYFESWDAAKARLARSTAQHGE